ncbi:unnamed protein product, partial [Laminaria digitata]
QRGGITKDNIQEVCALKKRTGKEKGKGEVCAPKPRTRNSGVCTTTTQKHNSVEERASVWLGDATHDLLLRSAHHLLRARHHDLFGVRADLFPHPGRFGQGCPSRPPFLHLLEGVQNHLPARALLGPRALVSGDGLRLAADRPQPLPRKKPPPVWETLRGAMCAAITLLSSGANRAYPQRPRADRNPACGQR